MEKQSGRLAGIIKFSVAEFLFFAYASLLSYQTLFLKSVIGLESTQIGTVTAVCAIISLVLIPVWGMISDRLHSAKAVLGICMVGAAGACIAISFLGTSLPASIGLVYVLLIAKYIFQQPANSLLDGWAISELAPHGVNYSTVRVWGSVGFASFCVLLGLTVGKVITIQAAFRICAGIGLCLAAIAFFSPRQKTAAKQSSPATVKDFLTLFRRPRFTIYMVFSIGLNLFVGVTLVYFPYILENVNVSTDMIGLFTGLRSGIEVLTMLTLVVLLRKKLHIGYIVALPGLFGAVEHFLYGSCDGAALVFVSMFFSGLAGGVFYGVGPAYIHSVVPEKLQNTAQTMAAFIATFVAVTGSFLGGLVIEHFGIMVLTRGCAIILIAMTALFVLSQILLKTPFAAAEAPADNS